tara:strand:- start:1196 stop:4441 length:3246 start_codon:yes stop_codon:yes gene_type:complete
MVQGIASFMGGSTKEQQLRQQSKEELLNNKTPIQKRRERRADLKGGEGGTGGIGKFATQLGVGVLPGAGVADVVGAFPDVEGGYEPSMLVNLQQAKRSFQEGNYKQAAIQGIFGGLQGLGGAGDVALAAAPFAPFALPVAVGAKTVSSVGKKLVQKFMPKEINLQEIGDKINKQKQRGLSATVGLSDMKGDYVVRGREMNDVRYSDYKLEETEADKIMQEERAKHKSLTDAKGFPKRSVSADKFNVGSFDGVTMFTTNVVLKPEELKGIKGYQGEEKRLKTPTGKDSKKLKNLKDSIAKEGYQPYTNPQIVVNHKGEPFVLEGNHRIQEAIDSGRPAIAVDIKYLTTGYRADGPLNPQKLIDENPLTEADLVQHQKLYDEFNFAGKKMQAKEQARYEKEKGIESLSVKDSVVNYVQSPSLMSRDELVKSLDSDPTVVEKSIKALKDLGKVNDDNTVTIYRRVPLRKGEELKDETIISGSHDVRAVRDADESLEGITTFDKFGQPKARGEEVFVKYKVPVDRIKGYLPEVGEYTRGTQARIQRAMQGKIDEKRKQGLGQFTKLKETKRIFEGLVNKEKEIIADVSGIKPEKVDREIIRGFGFDEIIEGKIKTADEFKKEYPNVTDDKVAKIRDAIVKGGDESLSINPKTGKTYTVEEYKDLDKQKTQENIDKIKDDFGLNIKGTETKGIASLPTNNLEVEPLLGLDIMTSTEKSFVKPSKGKKVVIQDIYDYLDKPTKLDFNDPKQYDQMLQEAKKEFEYQMQQKITGAGWYDEMTQNFMKKLDEVDPKFKNNDDAKDLTVVLTAILSSGQEVGGDLKPALEIMDNYFKTGNILTKNPKNLYSKKEAIKFGKPEIEGTPKPWTQQANPKALELTKAFIKDKGVRAFLDFVYSPTTRREASKIAEKYGLKPFSGRKDEEIFGADLFGPKIGLFMKNLLGMGGDEVVADIWFTRMMDRHSGNMFTMQKGKKVKNEMPRNVAERERNQKFIEDLSKLVGYNKRDVQAVKWYFEQGLYTNLGVKSDPKGYDEAIESILKRRANDTKRSLLQNNEAKIKAKRSEPTKLKKAVGGFVESSNYDHYRII